jgi:hypothetical protein
MYAVSLEPPISSAPSWAAPLLEMASRYAIVCGYASGPGDASVVSAGTSVAVDLRDATDCDIIRRIAMGDLGDLPRAAFLITAYHVVAPRKTHQQLYCFAGPVTPDLAGLSYDADLDLATIPLTDEQLQHLQQVGYLIQRPAFWPPLPPREGAPVVVSGYPYSHRMEFPISRAFIASPAAAAVRIELVKDLECVANIETIGTQMPLSPVLPPVWGTTKIPDGAIPNSLSGTFDMPGMSGGPVLAGSQGHILTLDLVGIVKKGVRFQERDEVSDVHSAYFARLEAVGIDGKVRNDNVTTTFRNWFRSELLKKARARFASNLQCPTCGEPTSAPATFNDPPLPAIERVERGLYLYHVTCVAGHPYHIVRSEDWSDPPEGYSRTLDCNCRPS